MVHSCCKQFVAASWDLDRSWRQPSPRNTPPYKLKIMRTPGDAVLSLVFVFPLVCCICTWLVHHVMSSDSRRSFRRMRWPLSGHDLCRPCKSCKAEAASRSAHKISTDESTRTMVKRHGSLFRPGIPKFQKMPELLSTFSLQ